jgi:superoxide dismutase
LPSGLLKETIERDFGSLDGLKTKFNAQIAAIQGSGWGWLGYDPSTGKLDIVTTANQDPLLCECSLHIVGDGCMCSKLTSRKSLLTSSRSIDWC